MKTKHVYALARTLLAERRQVIHDHLVARNRMAVDRMRTHVEVNQLRREVGNSRLAIAEASARMQNQLPRKRLASDSLQHIAQREERLMAKINADANVRAAVEKRLRSHAAQAAMDRATFVDQVKRDLPEELWGETIDAYDRKVYEAGEGGGT